MRVTISLTEDDEENPLHNRMSNFSVTIQGPAQVRGRRQFDGLVEAVERTIKAIDPEANFFTLLEWYLGGLEGGGIDDLRKKLEIKMCELNVENLGLLQASALRVLEAHCGPEDGPYLEFPAYLAREDRRIVRECAELAEKALLEEEDDEDHR